MATSSSDSVKIISPPNTTPNTFQNNKKGHYIASAQDFVSIIESNETDNPPPYFLSKLFVKNQHFVNDDPRKDYEFYNKILLYTKSIYVDHTKSAQYPLEYEYSKIKIIKVFHPQDWKQNWNRPYKFYNNTTRDSIQFTYHDYQKAWQVILLYQNRQYHHSWFLRFEAQPPLQIPNWFYSNWWTLYGPDEQIFPNNVKALFTKFASEQKFDPEMGHSRYHLLLQFYATYSIPWIIRWEYNIDIDDFPPTFKRTILCKWWEPYDIQHALNIRTAMNKESSKTPLHNMSYADTANFSSIKQKMKEALKNEGIITEEYFDKKLRELLSNQNQPLKITENQVKEERTTPALSHQADNNTPPYQADNSAPPSPHQDDDNFSKAVHQLLNTTANDDDNMNEDDCFGLM